MEESRCQALSSAIIEGVGGKENVAHVLHCASRLRFNLRDDDKADLDALKSIKGVIAAQRTQGQLQVVIGTEVGQVYDEVCRQGGFERLAEVPEDDAPKKKLTLKSLGGAIIDAISACVNPILPVIIAAGMVKVLLTLLGPGFAGVIAEGTDLYTLLTFVGDAGFYFFPVYVGWAGAKKFGCSVPVSLLLACILLHPTYTQIVADGQPFTVYGIPVVLTSYVSNFIPMILITWVQSYIEKFLSKHMPSALKVVLVPTCTVLIMLPLMFCFLGPLGNIIGQGIAAAMVWMHGTLGFLSTALIAAVWILLISTGMHQALLAIALGQMANPAIGYDDSIMVSACIAVCALYAIALSYAIRAKNAEIRSTGISYFITAVLGGIGEPTIFGVLFRYTRSILYVSAGGFIGGAVAGILGAKVYFFSGLGNIFMMLGFAGADPNSLFAGCAGGAIAFAVTFVIGLALGYGDDSKPLRAKEAPKAEAAA